MTQDEFLAVLDEADRKFAARELNADEAFKMRVGAIVDRWRTEVTEAGD